MKKSTLTLSRVELFNQIARDYGLDVHDVELIYEKLLLESIANENLESLFDDLFSSLEDDLYDPSSLPGLLAHSIYSTDSDEDIQKYMDIELMRLNEGSADLGDIKKLEEQAVNYFKNPASYHVNDHENSNQLKCYVEFYSHTEFSSDGKACDIYRSSGISFTCSLADIEDLSALEERVAEHGLYLDLSIRVKVYGNALYDIVGARAYRKGEKAVFAVPFNELPSILLAIPDSDAICDYEVDSYKALESIIAEEIPYGKSASEVLGGAMTSWVLYHEFYEERYPELVSEEEEIAFDRKLRSLQNKHLNFIQGFKEEFGLINRINERQISQDELEMLSSHQINRVLYVCKSNQFKQRIFNKGTYFQLQSLARRKAQSLKIAS